MQSDEHKFVTSAIIASFDSLSESRLFGYSEADRGMFDFACNIVGFNRRELIGQTLTHHAAGIDKDLASLLHSDPEILPIYAFPNEAKHEGRVQQFLVNARPSLPRKVELLRLLRYPTFDASVESERMTVANKIREFIRDDLILTVMMGRLSAVDVGLFLQSTGIQGLAMAALDAIADHGFVNFPTLADRIGVSPSTLRPRVQALVTSGLLEQAVGASMFRSSARGCALLKLCAIALENRESVELEFILEKLKLALDITPRELTLEEILVLEFSPVGKMIHLLSEALSARRKFGARVGTDYEVGRVGVGREIDWIGR